MKKITIGLVEIGDSFGGQYYFPYSLGILKAYAEKTLSLGEDAFLPMIYKRGSVDRDVEALCGADIVFFSAYLWNFQASIEIARRIREKKPEVVIVVGGPQVPESHDRLRAFLGRHPFIDIAAFGEGERPFVRIIENSRTRSWEAVPSIGYRRPDGSLAVSPFQETIEDINEIPSPYLCGVFDELIGQNPRERWQGRIETNRGCPFTCAFCYWGKRSDRKVKTFDLDRVYGEIDWLSRQRIEFVFCCDANFGLLKRDCTIAQKVAANKAAFGYPKAFSVQNTKNSRERIFALQKILNDAGLQKGVNLALQSLNEETLGCIERSNIDNATYADLQKLFTKNNIPTFTDLIIALPGETYDTFTRGVGEIIANGQHNRIQFINLTVLENTLMANPEFQQEHGLEIVEAAMVPHHSSPGAMGSIAETQQLVIATRSMPARDWIRTRVFSWLASLLHFDKLLQVPFIVLHEVAGISYRELIELFMIKGEGQKRLDRIVSVFEQKAAGIQQGDSEYSFSEEWLNITWYPDEWLLITLCADGAIGDFYAEAEERLLAWAGRNAGRVEPAVISQAVHLNRSALKQPFVADDLSFQSDCNLWEIYQAALRGEHAPLAKGAYRYRIDRTTQSWTSREEWCREVIWYGNKKGDYLYPVQRS
jgi:radical SAM superfamily enzyme YgiQ (UPF0313 family)